MPTPALHNAINAISIRNAAIFPSQVGIQKCIDMKTCGSLLNFAANEHADDLKVPPALMHQCPLPYCGRESVETPVSCVLTPHSLRVNTCLIRGLYRFCARSSSPPI
jgi:hypothetical protein